MAARLRTKSLQLVPATAQHVLIALEGGDKLARSLGAERHESWPPAGLDENTLRAVLDRLHRDPDARTWGLWFVLHHAKSGRPSLRGGLRFEHGPQDGAVSLTYTLDDAELAREAVQALLEWAFEEHEAVLEVRAKVDAQGPSASVLDSLGFEESDADELLYSRTRDAWLKDGPSWRRCPPLVTPADDAAIEGLPNMATDVFAELLREPLRPTAQTREAVGAYVQFLESEAASNASVDVAQARDIARVCEGLLDAVAPDTPQLVQLQIQAAARYFVTEADGDSDLDIGGLDEDAAVANAVARHLGREDLVHNAF